MESHVIYAFDKEGLQFMFHRHTGTFMPILNFATGTWKDFFCATDDLLLANQVAAENGLERVGYIHAQDALSVGAEPYNDQPSLLDQLSPLLDQVSSFLEKRAKPKRDEIAATVLPYIVGHGFDAVIAAQHAFMYADEFLKQAGKPAGDATTTGI